MSKRLNWFLFCLCMMFVTYLVLFSLGNRDMALIMSGVVIGFGGAGITVIDRGGFK